MTQYDKVYRFYIRLKDIRRELKAARSELRLMREAAVNDQYGGNGGNGTQGGRNERSKVEDGTLRVMALESRIAETVKRYEEVRFEVERTIEQLANLNERTVLKMRYLYFKRFEDIVAMTGYSRTQVFRFHRNGINNTVITEV